MTSSELGMALGHLGDLFQHRQIESLVEGEEVEVDLTAGQFLEVQESAESLYGGAIDASSFRDDNLPAVDGCSGKGIKVVCVAGSDCCLYVKFKKLRPIFSLCCS